MTDPNVADALHRPSAKVLKSVKEMKSLLSDKQDTMFVYVKKLYSKGEKRKWRKRERERERERKERGKRDGKRKRVNERTSECLYASVCPTEGFLRRGTQVGQFGRKLVNLDAS